MVNDDKGTMSSWDPEAALAQMMTSRDTPERQRTAIVSPPSLDCMSAETVRMLDLGRDAVKGASGCERLTRTRRQPVRPSEQARDAGPARGELPGHREGGGGFMALSPVVPLPGSPTLAPARRSEERTEAPPFLTPGLLPARSAPVLATT